MINFVSVLVDCGLLHIVAFYAHCSIDAETESLHIWLFWGNDLPPNLAAVTVPAPVPSTAYDIPPSRVWFGQTGVVVEGDLAEINSPNKHLYQSVVQINHSFIRHLFRICLLSSCLAPFAPTYCTI